MKFGLLFTLIVLAASKDLSKTFADAKSMQVEVVESEVETLSDCRLANSPEDCLANKGE